MNEDIHLANSDDSSDEEVVLRTGGVPVEWYNEFDHAGYDTKGKRVEKMKELDEVEELLRR